MDRRQFFEDVKDAVNRNSMESLSDTPDWLIADYLVRCYEAFAESIKRREEYYGRGPKMVPVSEWPEDTGRVYKSTLQPVGKPMPMPMPMPTDEVKE